MLVRELKTIKMGQPDDFSNFVSAVIDKNSFNNIKSYIDEAKVYSQQQTTTTTYSNNTLSLALNKITPNRLPKTVK